MNRNHRNTKSRAVDDSPFFLGVAEVIHAARQGLAKQVNSAMVVTYFEIGRRIVEKEQQGAKRAQYGKQVLQGLANYLTDRFGRGLSFRNLNLMRQFFLAYSGRRIDATSPIQSHDSKIVQTLSAQFNPAISWSHYLLLMRIANREECRFYEHEIAANNWSFREFQRQFDSALYERLALSRDKRKVRELADKGQLVSSPQDLFKDPYVLEFTGLPEKVAYSETELESRLIGQMQMYVNLHDRTIKLPDENPTVGIILCKDKNDAVVEMMLPETNRQVFASKYQTALPSKDELRKALEEGDLSP